MLYSIIYTELGRQHGLRPDLHQTTANGTKMVVNENELRLVNSDIDKAAQLLGGEVMTQGEVVNELKKNKFIQS